MSETSVPVENLQNLQIAYTKKKNQKKAEEFSAPAAHSPAATSRRSSLPP
jgi:hypothetical protein